MTTTETYPASTTNGVASGKPHADLRIAAGKVQGLRKGQRIAELDDKAWQKWSQHLAERKTPLRLEKVTGAKQLASLWWEIPCDSVDADTHELTDLLATASKSKKSSSESECVQAAKAWLAERCPTGSTEDTDRLGCAIECLAIAHALPRLANSLGKELWSELLQSLLSVAADSSEIDPEQHPVAFQLLAGELPLTLWYLFPEIESCRKLGKTARRSIARGMDQLLDGQGEIAAQHFGVARVLLASWLRSAQLGDAAEKQTFDATTRRMLQWFIRQSIGMMRPDGTQMLAATNATWDRSFFTAAVETFGASDERKLAKALLPGKEGSKSNGKRKSLEKQFGFPATNSEWASMALLRSSWQSDSPRLLLDYATNRVRSELCVDDRILFSGDCSPEIQVDGQRLEFDAFWSEVCWHSDEDVDYVEIEAELTGDWKCQRQFLLDRKDRLLYVADALLGPQAGDVSYRCDWPIAENLRVVSEDETAECTLAAGKRKLVRVLPLALPEWKCDTRRHGALTPNNDKLTLELEGQAQRLYAPLVFDLDTDRMKYPFTWRQLTVARELEHVPRDVAVGYRVQLRLDQWLIYRSLDAVASRTVLGQNFFLEFVCGRFDHGGEVEALVEVE